MTSFALYEEFAKHILTKSARHEFRLQCILDCHAAGRSRQSEQSSSLASGSGGIAVPRGSKHMSTLRLWLERAGNFRDRVIESIKTRLNEVLGVSMEVF